MEKIDNNRSAEFADLPTQPQQLLDLLAARGYQCVTHHHEAVFTVEESNHITAQIAGGHTKNLFVKDKKGNYFLIIVENNARVSLNHVHSLIGAQSRVSFANAERLMEYLGVKPGSVNAFAPINDKQGIVKVIIDEPLLRFDEINCHPLTNTMTTTISKADLIDFLNFVDHPPLIVKLSSETEMAEKT